MYQKLERKLEGVGKKRNDKAGVPGEDITTLPVSNLEASAGTSLYTRAHTAVPAVVAAPPASTMLLPPSAVRTFTAPVDIPMPYPDVIEVAPPFFSMPDCASSVFPAATVMRPPGRLVPACGLLVPADTATVPLAPWVAAPVRSTTSPLEPVVDAPVTSVTAPLVSEGPPVAMLKAPLCIRSASQWSLAW